MNNFLNSEQRIIYEEKRVNNFLNNTEQKIILCRILEMVYVENSEQFSRENSEQFYLMQKIVLLSEQFYIQLIRTFLQIQIFLGIYYEVIYTNHSFFFHGVCPLFIWLHI